MAHICDIVVINDQNPHNVGLYPKCCAIEIKKGLVGAQIQTFNSFYFKKICQFLMTPYILVDRPTPLHYRNLVNSGLFN